MRKIVLCLLVMVLLASAVPLAITPAGAQQAGIPCDGEDNELTKEELVNAILPYMLDEGNLKLDDVGDAAYVYAYWDGKPKAITDDEKVETTLYRPPERIIAAYSLYYMPLQILKVTDTIVAISWPIASYDLFYAEHIFPLLYPALEGLPNVGGSIGTSLDYEELLKQQPDFVFMASGGYSYSQYNKLRAVVPDVPIVRLSIHKSYDRPFYEEHMRTLGYLLDKEEETEEFLDYYGGFLDIIEEKVEDIPEEDKPRVYFMSLPGYYGWKQYKKGITEVVEAAGGNDIFSDVEDSAVDAEWVIKRDPEVIICQAWEVGGYGIEDVSRMKETRDKIMRLPELANVTAVKTGRVYVVSTDLVCCGARGGRHFLSVAQFAKIIYPDLNIDPTALHQEFLTEFQGVVYDLSKHGTFVYHPEEYPEGR